MRKSQIKDILELFKSIYSAHSVIAKNIQKCEFDKAEMILEECQNCAIEVGSLIEKSEGEGCITVKLLEEYCESVYQMAISLKNGDNRAGKIERVLTKQLIAVENSVKKDIRARYEIVFLPYKASMWDSLESIWRAAYEDENCDVYVVPIPYFERMQDGSLGEMHYEGEDYPQNIPIIDWQEYDIEIRRPDIIYIHNPYDDMNYVTSVHPNYYSANLKKYTDCLVYVPYFVGMEDRVERKLCMTPAVLYADRIIVQSEAVRQIYIEEYRKMEKENDCVNFFGVAEEKFVGLGSPKLDAVNFARETEWPEEWTKMLYNKSGFRKKVVLFNTTVGAILIYREEYLTKLRDTIEIFKECKEQILMLWRPHPLFRSTITSMAPELLQEYDEIVDTYKKENVGIFDESSNLDRAIEFSDAYYGDKSSVVEIYKKTDKLIMIQNLR